MATIEFVATVGGIDDYGDLSLAIDSYDEWEKVKTAVWSTCAGFSRESAGEPNRVVAHWPTPGRPSRCRVKIPKNAYGGKLLEHARELAGADATVSVTTRFYRFGGKAGVSLTLNSILEAPRPAAVGEPQLGGEF